MKYKQKKFHFIPRNMFKFLFQKLKEVDNQFISLNVEFGEFNFVKWNGKKYINISDINAIDISEISKGWSENEWEYFENYEKKLSKLESYFYEKYFINFNEEVDIDHSKSAFDEFNLLDTGIKSTTTESNLDDSFNNVGEIKNFNIYKYLWFIKEQSKLVMDWKTQKDVSFMEMIGKLYRLMESKECRENKKWKAHSQMRLSINEGKIRQRFCISTNMFSIWELFEDIRIIIVPVTNETVVMQFYVKTPMKNENTHYENIVKAIRHLTSLFSSENELGKKEFEHHLFYNIDYFLNDKNFNITYFISPKSIENYCLAIKGKEYDKFKSLVISDVLRMYIGKNKSKGLNEVREDLLNKYESFKKEK